MSSSKKSSDSKQVTSTNEISADDDYDPEIMNAFENKDSQMSKYSVSSIPGFYHKGESGRYTVHDPLKKYSYSPIPDIRDGSKSVPVFSSFKDDLYDKKGKKEWGGKTHRRKMHARKSVKRGRSRTSKKHIHTFKKGGKKRKRTRKHKRVRRRTKG